MAIGTTPLFNKISGSVGPVDYRTRRNGKIEIGKKRIPANPQSTRQSEVRAGYGRLHELWQNASYIDKAQYERLGELYNTSAWNAFLMRHQSAMSAAPTASWGMVESSGSDLHDLSSNEIHGTISGATWEILKPASMSILKLDGIDDFVTLGIAPKLDFTQAISIMSWVAPDNLTTDNAIFITGSSKYQLLRISNAGELVFRIWDSGGTMRTLTSVSKLPKTHQWYNLCASFDGEKMKLFINGALNNDLIPAPGNMTIITGESKYFGSFLPSNNPFAGLFGMGAIYDHALTDTQFKNFYENTRHMFGV